MITLTYKPKPSGIRYPDDVKTIIDAFKDQGMQIDEQSAQHAWEDYSSELCASWLFVQGYGTPQEIINNCMPYLTEITPPQSS